MIRHKLNGMKFLILLVKILFCNLSVVSCFGGDLTIYPKLS